MKKNALCFVFNLFNSNCIIALVILCPTILFGQIQHNLLVDLDFENGTVDSSSENQATIISGSSSYTTDKFGNTNACIKFNGTSNNGSVFLTSDVTGTYKMNFPASFSAWVNISAFGTLSSPVLTTEDHGSAYSGFWVEVSPAGAVQAHFGNGFGTSPSDKKTFETASGVINLNTWHHIVVVFKSANEATIYVDGFAKPTTVSGNATSCYYYRVIGTAGKIGGYVKGTGNRSMNGKIDKVKFFDVALTQSEVFALNYVKHNNHSTLLFNYNMNNNYNDTSIYHQTSGPVGTCQYGPDQQSYSNAALNVSTNSAIEIREATGNFKTTFPMTFASWIKVDALGSINPIFTNDDNTSSYTGVWIQILGNGTIGVNIGDGSGTSASARRSYVTSNALGADSQWKHLAVVLKAAPSPALYTAQIYVDGVLWSVGTQSGTGAQLLYNTNTGNWGKLGCYNKGSSSLSAFSGSLDGSMFWNDSLTQAEVSNIFNNYYTGCLTLPTIQANSSANTVCNGTAISLNGGGGATYVWTGGVSNGSSFTPTSTATYTVTGTDINNCSNTDSISITVNDLPTIIITPSATTVCAGTSVSLNASGASLYSWTDGVTNQVLFIPTSTKTYTVTATDLNNCSNSDSISITVNDLPIITVNASADSVCAGTTVTLQADGANTYAWTGNIINNAGFVPTATATYTVTGTDLNMCSNTATATVVVNQLPDTNISVSGNTITATTLAEVTYQWGNCNNGFSAISGETNQSFTATVVGNYAVVVTLNGCSDTSACTTISSVGISDKENETIFFYPNPTNGLVNIINKQKETLALALEDYSGKLVYSTQIVNEKQLIDFSSYANGIYFLKLKNNKETTTQKLVISK